MKKSILLFALLAPLFAFSQNVKKVDKFDNLRISTDIQATLVQYHQYKVEYKMLKGDEDALHIENKGDALVIKIKGDGWFSSSKAQVTVYAPNPSIAMTTQLEQLQ